MKRVYIIALLLIAGFSLRVYDLTDLPLDFHPTRQLLSLIKARGMYYATLSSIPEEQREIAINQWHSKTTFEPELLERLVVFTYRYTGEQVWIARIYSSLFWMIGGIFLYRLARDLVSENGAILSLTFYLFLPYGVFASRSFQPDPLMLMLTLAFWWTVQRWSRHPISWRFAILSGLFGGLAIFIKFVAAFFVIGAGVGALLLNGEKIRTMVHRPQVWVMTVLGILPGAYWLIYGLYITDFLNTKFEGRFIPALLISPAFYLSWMSMLNIVIGGGLIALALLGLFFHRQRIFIISLWMAYFIYGIFFDYHISTHDYYSLMIIPIAALSLAPFADLILPQTSSRLSKIFLLFFFCFGVFATAWDIRSQLKETDYRPEAAVWTEIGQTLGPRAKITALTQDYGARLEYWGWEKATIWPLYGDLVYHVGLKGANKGFETLFANLADRSDFFLVTMPEELSRQPELKERLAQYPVFAEGEGYIIYDLKSP
ncbi:MAG: glycosyltransferase family 39 protein [Anaerolineales bacterium]|nr:glycosyltransferase family 39 protein [Anaerolineales bacterium]